MAAPALPATAAANEPAHHVAVGERTLELMSELETFNRWVFEAIRPYIGRRVLEAGAGIGNFTALLADRDLVVAAELEAERVARLDRRFADRPNVIAEAVDLTDPGILRLAAHRFDTVVCLNVLEHIRDHSAALRHMAGVLQPGGRLVLLVPAHPALYGTLDERLGHVRRYRAPELHRLLTAAGLEVERRFALNLFGIFGWWLNGRVLRRSLLPRNQLRLFDRLAPLFQRLERLTGQRVGLSIVFVGRKPRPGA